MPIHCPVVHCMLPHPSSTFALTPHAAVCLVSSGQNCSRSALWQRPCVAIHECVASGSPISLLLPPPLRSARRRWPHTVHAPWLLRLFRLHARRGGRRKGTPPYAAGGPLLDLMLDCYSQQLSCQAAAPHLVRQLLVQPCTCRRHLEAGGVEVSAL